VVARPSSASTPSACTWRRSRCRRSSVR
jgi:hypothetical protein